MSAEQHTNWPDWWHWELELTAHLLKRMVDRGFTEVDLRSMMERASGLAEDDEPGRWVVRMLHDARPWEVIVGRTPPEDYCWLSPLTLWTCRETRLPRSHLPQRPRRRRLLYLPRCDGDRSARTHVMEDGLVIDYTEDGRPIGIEITRPTRFDAAQLNQVLTQLGHPPVTPDEFAPLRAA